MKTKHKPNQPDNPKAHPFSSHTDHCVCCDKGAQGDAIENTSCGSDHPAPCQSCNGRGWIFIDTGNDQMSRHEIKRCGICEQFGTDLAAVEAAEKITQAQPALLKFVRQIAGMKREGEPDHDGPYEPTSEDAIATRNGLILKARHLHRLYRSCDQAETTHRKITQEQEDAIRAFIDCWNLSMPYHDIGSALNCGECNALHEMLVAFGANEAAEALMEAHVEGDDKGDDPAHWQFKTRRKAKGVSPA